MAREWTPAQLSAMNARGHTLLVSAAAGSGKTATLTERIIRSLTDPEHPAELSRMLIVTFTRAAAAELKQRISEALTEAMSKDPRNRHLQKQLLDLGSAHISTIDAFCMEPMRAHFAEAGLPASFRIADEAELAPLSERVMDELIDAYYKKYAPSTEAGGERDLFSMLSDNPFADLCDALTPARNDEGLPKLLRALYDKLLTYPEGLERLKKQAETLEAQADGDFFASEHGRVLRAWLQDFTLSAEDFLDKALHALGSDLKAVKAYASSFAYDLEFVRQLSQTDTYNGVRKLLLSYAPPSLKPLRGAGEEMAVLKARRAMYTDEIKKKFRDVYFTDDPGKISADMKQTALMCRVLYDFLSAYDARMTAEKRQRGICDFTDNRRNLLKLLTGPDGGPSALAEEYRANFDEVYIDEYQDVDEVQDTIFRLVGGDHRFMVGDIKQSIYTFRGADPSVFARYRQLFPPLGEEATDDADAGREETEADAQDGGRSLFMSENFRCDRSVIQVTNGICGHIFSACPDSVNYQPEDDLVFAKKPPEEGYQSPRVEIDILYKEKDDGTYESSESNGSEDEFEKAEAGSEYIHVANRIADLLRSGATLANGGPMTPGDIAILVRSKTGFASLAAALTAEGLPIGCEELDANRAGQNILRGPDMKYLVNLLRVLDDPDSDSPLSEVLRAPFPGFSLEELVDFRRAGAGSLYEGLLAYPRSEMADPALSERVKEFVTWLESYRELCTTLSADHILRLLRQDKHVAARHSKAFLYLYDSARTCRVGSFVGVYAFLRFFEKKLETAKDGPTEGDAGGGGHISIMTIHHAKGLEFPVCFVIRCGAPFGGNQGSGDLLFEKQTGIGMKLFDRKEGRKYATALVRVSALASRLHDREDEMRILYVAMTRARERLYLCGTGSEQLPPSFSAGDRFAILSCRRYMQWITAAWQAHPHLASFSDLNMIPLSSVTPAEPLPRQALTQADTTDKTAAYYRRLAATAPLPTAMEALLRSVPTKVPASRMVDHMLDRCVFFSSDLPVGDEDKLPESERGAAGCDPQTLAAIRESLRLMETAGQDELELLMAEGRKPTAAERGTATHLFLQFCDFDRVSACLSHEDMDDALMDGVDQEISRLQEKGFINRRTADMINRTQIAAFFKSHFFEEVRRATRIRREFRFNRFLPLSTLTENTELQAALGERTLYVQGSVDLICEYADGSLMLCDYKTDRLTAEERADPSLCRLHMSQRHGAQLAQYVSAVREIYGLEADRIRTCIYSVALGESIPVQV